MKFLILITSFLIVSQAQAQQKVTGQVTDTSNRPLAYVNIGIEERGVGTVSNAQGYFELSIPESMSQDTLCFSHIGYKTQCLLIAPSMQVVLDETSKILESVNVEGKAFREKEIGNRSKSGFLISGFSHGDLGGEVGSKFNIKHLSFIERFGFHIDYMSFDSVRLRLNIYAADHNRVDEKLTTSQVFTIYESGAHEIELVNSIEIDQDVIVTLELLAHFPQNKGSVYFSQSPPFLGKMYYRETSFDVVKKYIGGPMSMFLIIKYEK